MLSFYIPLIFVLIIYAYIYRAAKTAVDTRSSVQMSQFLPSNSISTNIGQTSGLLAQQKSNGNSCSSPQLFADATNPNANNSNNSSSPQIGGSRQTLKRSKANTPEPKPSGLLSPTRCLGRRLSTPFNGRLSIFVQRRYSIFRHVHLPNQKAIRTLGVILGTFIICWLPFMSFAIIKPLYEYLTGLTGNPRPLNAPVWIDTLLLWFGYISAMLNPVIYSKFNREFRTPFREIIYCRCKGLNEIVRRQEYLENVHGESHLQLTAPPHMVQSSKNSGNLKAAV